MMTELFRKEETSFRIVGLPVDLLSDLENTVPNHGVKTNRNVKSARFHDINSVVVFFEILPNFDYSRLHFFLLNNKIAEDSYGIWTSLVTDGDNDGVHLPEHVLEFYKLIGGNIDFSFVCTGS